jgi:hypothetical protein
LQRQKAKPGELQFGSTGAGTGTHLGVGTFNLNLLGALTISRKLNVCSSTTLLLPNGFSNRDLRQHFAALLGQLPQSLSPGQMGYHLRRLRLHGIIERILQLIAIALPIPACAPSGSAHEPTAASSAQDSGILLPDLSPPNSPLRRCFDRLDQEITSWIEHTKLAA